MTELPTVDTTRMEFGLDLLERGQLAITEAARSWGPAFRIGRGDSVVVILSGEHAPSLLSKMRAGELTEYDGRGHWRPGFGGEKLLGGLDGAEIRRLRSYFNPALNVRYLAGRIPELYWRTRDTFQKPLSAGRGVDVATLASDVAAAQFEATLRTPMSAEFRRRLKRSGTTTEGVAVKGLSSAVASLPLYWRTPSSARATFCPSSTSTPRLRGGRHSSRPRPYRRHPAGPRAPSIVRTLRRSTVGVPRRSDAAQAVRTAHTSSPQLDDLLADVRREIPSFRSPRRTS